MGYAHVLWIYEDGIQQPSGSDTTPRPLAEEVGEAVLKVSLDPTYELTPSGHKPIRSHPVFELGNCVNHAAELHSTDEQIFVWARNCLRTLDQLRDDELEGVKRLFDDLYEQRKNRGT